MWPTMGTVSVPLAGKVQVAGVSPAEASGRIQTALHVSITVTQSRSQRVSVLGQVDAPTLSD